MEKPLETQASGEVRTDAGPPISLARLADLRMADPFVNGGEMAAMMRGVDWAATPLGPVETWSPTLQTMVSFLLANRLPILLRWGPDYIQLYNDAYVPVLGTKHPQALGRPTRETWHEIFDIIGPLIDTPFHGGPATYMDDILLEINRHGFFEETHFRIAYSPVPDPTAPRGIGGVIATVHETTEEVISQRRVLALRDLGTRAITEARTAEQASAAAAEIVSRYSRDIPFALIYLLEADGSARLAGTAGVDAGQAISPTVIDPSAEECAWPVREALESGMLYVVDHLGDRFAEIPAGPWDDAPHTGIVVPIASNIANRPAGVLIAGVSPRHGFDEQYASFFELASRQIATAVANARAYEDERKRAEALAELDRAKTQFFSNVSHEFRTPLTLLLGPTQDALADPAITPPQRERLAVINRSALRMQRLVNSLLDFSRIEAGRVHAIYEPTDLATYTADLASNFHSATDRAGLALVIDAGAVDEPAYVDREMWEKVVLNLVSNAFKHTFEGEIRVSLAQRGGDVELVVADTGVGIPKDQIPHLFERFHRVTSTRSRTHEGTGIGLALVYELVKLHGGAVAVSSEEGVGSAFSVRIPLGTAHLPQDRLAAAPRRTSTAAGAASFVEEALRWLPDAEAGADADDADASAPVHAAVASARILVADDNADMRHYLARLLREHGWHVDVAADGMAARDAVQARTPDLVITDVMMPGLDGFALMRELAGDAATNDVPIILLSARAGEEARVEGIEAGADDYLVKPFAARELIARVSSTLQLSRMRRELRQHAAQLETLLASAPIGVYLVDADFKIAAVNPPARVAFGGEWDVVGRDFNEVMFALRGHARADTVAARFRHTLETGEPYVAHEDSPLGDDGSGGFFEWQTHRIPLPDGRFGVVCYFRDISAQVLARREAEAARASAESANNAKSDFLAAMSHELRTPLNAIGGYVQLLAMGVHGPLSDEQQQVLSRIELSERHLLSLITDVLNFAKIEAGKVDYEIATVSLEHAVATVGAMIAPQLMSKRLRYETRLERGEAIRADPEKLQQILLNLLSNAIKFTAPGGRIVVDVPERVGMPPQTVFLRVSDTGNGIPREKQDDIFEPFVQVDRGLSRPTEGTGLGLAISRDLARGMGGDLRVRSDVGSGSSFTLSMPAS